MIFRNIGKHTKQNLIEEQNKLTIWYRGSSCGDKMMNIKLVPFNRESDPIQKSIDREQCGLWGGQKWNQNTLKHNDDISSLPPSYAMTITTRFSESDWGSQSAQVHNQLLLPSSSMSVDESPWASTSRDMNWDAKIIWGTRVGIIQQASDQIQKSTGRQRAIWSVRTQKGNQNTPRHNAHLTWVPPRYAMAITIAFSDSKHRINRVYNQLLRLDESPNA